MAARRILLIDDNQDFLNLLTRRLTFEGYAVVSAQSGEAGRRIAEAGGIDLILLDMLMPEQDGITTYQALRTEETTRAIPVILLTSVAVEGHWEPLSDTDAQSFVMGKPYNYTSLLARIEQVLGPARAGEQE